jgi:hypothetical protein
MDDSPVMPYREALLPFIEAAPDFGNALIGAERHVGVDLAGREHAHTDRYAGRDVREGLAQRPLVYNEPAVDPGASQTPEPKPLDHPVAPPPILM